MFFDSCVCVCVCCVCGLFGAALCVDNIASMSDACKWTWTITLLQSSEVEWLPKGNVDCVGENRWGRDYVGLLYRPKDICMLINFKSKGGSVHQLVVVPPSPLGYPLNSNFGEVAAWLRRNQNWSNSYLTVVFRFLSQVTPKWAALSRSFAETNQIKHIGEEREKVGKKRQVWTFTSILV